jgi:C_GCAxxG_C_C family probable redox protein
MSKQETAKKKFDSGFNCAQSVLTPFARQMNIDVDMALKIASGFGAGMGRTQGTCGALTGAYMVLGLKYGKQMPDDDSNDKVAGMIQDLTHKFESEHGFTNCKDLLNVDLTTNKGQDAFAKNNLHSTVCTLCVNSAVDLLEKILGEE